MGENKFSQSVYRIVESFNVFDDKDFFKPHGGIKFLEMLTVLFVGLRLTKHINWPWFWVICPLLVQVFVSLLRKIAGHLSRKIGNIGGDRYWRRLP